MRVALLRQGTVASFVWGQRKEFDRSVGRIGIEGRKEGRKPCPAGGAYAHARTSSAKDRLGFLGTGNQGRGYPVRRFGYGDMC